PPRSEIEHPNGTPLGDKRKLSLLSLEEEEGVTAPPDRADAVLRQTDLLGGQQLRQRIALQNLAFRAQKRQHPAVTDLAPLIPKHYMPPVSGDVGRDGGGVHSGPARIRD